MTLVKDLIPIPERVQRGDFVLNLTTGLAPGAAEQTLAEYVVTEQLAGCFEDALSFVKSAVAGGQSRNKGAYLHGSFGSGKSHFMAVLNLLLAGHPGARAIPELAKVVARHSDWMQSRNILLVPYHMIGAASLEAGVLGGYAGFIRQRHAEAPEPGFYLSGRLFDDARALRARMGDGAFFAALNSAAGDDDWGDAAGGWDAASFEAVAAGRGSEGDRTALVSALVGSLFTAYSDLARSQAGGYLDFDRGLGVLTAHAKALGYDAVILFLDELILWLASRLSDRAFIGSEIQKVVKLVETSSPRELPVVSFIARQRDLREFVGDQYSGVEQEVLSDSLKYWDGRFHTISLEDSNLPVIAERRLLAPADAGARARIDEAFAQTERMREETFNLLLTSKFDRDQFRKLYPFSPALVQALVALSSALQRERTALKVMLMLLVAQRDTLALGQVIPVGDLYDVIASEAEPFSEEMRRHFENAKSLFERKLLPLLEADHKLPHAELDALPADDPRRRAFNNDLRLLKTLVLAALAPQVESLKQITATKLAALNHGTIRSPIPGQEAQTVLQRCRKWAGQVGEIKISDDPNPTIGLQLSGVDTESILEQARINDNDGNRRRLVRAMVFDAFGIRDDNQLFVVHEWTWRGTRRRADVLFLNVREVADDATFESRDEDWKVIIDFPFDSGSFSPTDDQARVREYEAAGGQARTICWIPYFLSPTLLKSLGKLVVLEDVLKSDESYARYSQHLSPQDRAVARSLLDNQRSQLRTQIKDALMAAYGVSEAPPGTLDHAGLLESQLISLQPGFRPRPPQGTTMDKAFEQLLDQALGFQYPDHPELGCELRPSDLGRVLGELRRAMPADGGRIEVDAPLRALMRDIAEPLGLGEMHERHFILGQGWPQQLHRELARARGGAGEAITVAALRAAIDSPRARGLPELVQNLLILVFAEQGQYAFTFHGGPYDGVSLKDMPDALVLIKQALPEPATWKQALDNAAALFGLAPKPLLTANNQNGLQQEVRECVTTYLEPCRSLVDDLAGCLGRVGLGESGNRMVNARLAVTVLETLEPLEGPELVSALAGVKPATSLQALALGMTTATRVAAAIADNNWALLEKVWADAGAPGAAIKRRVEDALAADELVTSLVQALKQAQVDATGILVKPITPPPPPPPPPTPPPGKTPVVIKQGERRGLSKADAEVLLDDVKRNLGPDITLDIAYTLTKLQP